MNAPVFLLHPGKQVTQGWNREIAWKKKKAKKEKPHWTDDKTKLEYGIQPSQCTEY